MSLIRRLRKIFRSKDRDYQRVTMQTFHQLTQSIPVELRENDDALNTPGTWMMEEDGAIIMHYPDGDIVTIHANQGLGGSPWVPNEFARKRTARRLCINKETPLGERKDHATLLLGYHKKERPRPVVEAEYKRVVAEWGMSISLGYTATSTTDITTLPTDTDTTSTTTYSPNLLARAVEQHRRMNELYRSYTDLTSDNDS